MNELAYNQNQAITPIAITVTDRLSLTLSLAILVHALFILGITFTEEDRLRSKSQVMEVTLVQKSSTPPDTADRLAQVSLQGGGDTTEDRAPATLLPAPFPDIEPQLVTPLARQQDQTEKRQSMPTSAEKNELKKTILATKAVTEKESTDTKRIADAQKNQLPVTSSALSTAALLNNSLKIAALSAQIQRKIEKKAKRPRRKFISANVKEYKYAAYEEAWRAKIEQVGNLNYPEAARRQNLSGSLVLDVALNTDGSVNEITVRRSSGKKMLDAAAIKIVKLAAPFSPFPQQMQKETDILHIIRTWQFTDKHSFR